MFSHPSKKILLTLHVKEKINLGAFWVQWDLTQKLLLLSCNLVLLSVHKWFVFFLQQKLWIHSFSISVLCKHIFPSTSIFQCMECILQTAHPWSCTDGNKPSTCRSLKSQTTRFSFYLYSKTTTPWLDSNRTSNPRTFTADMYLCYNSHLKWDDEKP